MSVGRLGSFGRLMAGGFPRKVCAFPVVGDHLFVDEVADFELIHLLTQPHHVGRKRSTEHLSHFRERSQISGSYAAAVLSVR
jgi:hypothetical protein